MTRRHCLPVALWAWLAGPACAATWTALHAGPTRTGYLEDAALVPPFALAWTRTSAESVAGAPVVAAGRVFIADAGLGVACLDAESGAVRWVAAPPPDRRQARGLDVLSGRTRWTVAVAGDLVRAPQVAEAFAWIASAAGEVIAVDQASGRQRWKRTLVPPLTAVASDGVIAVVGADRDLVGLDAATGDELFRVRLAGRPVGPPMLGGSRVCVALSRELLCLNRGGRQCWRVRVKSAVAAEPVVTPVGLLAGLSDGTHLLIGLETGGVLWERLVAGVPTVLAAVGDAAYAGTRQGTVVGLALDGGETVWSAKLADAAVTGLAAGGGRLIVTAGAWAGAFVPAPNAPAAVRIENGPGGATLLWDASVPNGAPVLGYRVWQRRGGNWSRVSDAPGLGWRLGGALPGDAEYAVSAVDVDGVEGPRSAETRLGTAEPLVRGLTIAPLPFVPQRGVLTASFDLRLGARVRWRVEDGAGRPVSVERTVVLPPGAGRLMWDGIEPGGRLAEPATYRMRLAAEATETAQQTAAAFRLEWGTGVDGSGGGGFAAAGSPGAPAGGNGPATGESGAPGAPHDNGAHEGANPNDFTIDHHDQGGGRGNGHGH